MKNRYLTICLLLLIAKSTAVAQQTAQPIGFANGNFNTVSNIARQLFKKSDLDAALFGDQYFAAIQFRTLPSATLQNNLKKAGINLYNYLPGKAYFATIRTDFNFSDAVLFNIISINTIPAFYKTDAALQQQKPALDKQSGQLVAIRYYTVLDKNTVKQQLRLLGATIVNTRFDAADIIFIQYNFSLINKIAALPFVISISVQSTIDKQLNYNSIGAHGISNLNSPMGKNLQGRGITIGIGDNADISSHTDFTGRIIGRTPAPATDHGTHVSGTAAGAGIINVKNRGIAPHAIIINHFFSNVIINAPTYTVDHNMVLTNNSYHTVEAGCPGNGKYDVLSNYADAQLRSYPQLLHVIAAGNEGSSSCSSYLPGFGTVKSGWQSAKNVLTVGAMNTQDYSIAYFSSRGPVKDGRLKPEITAGGWAVVSTNANNNYGANFGTSMSTPAVTGVLALMYQRYRQLHGGANPSAALMKALVCNTAEDLGNAGPDYTFGFGMLNGGRAIAAIDSNRYITQNIANGATNTHSISVPANTRRLKIMLYWADAEAAVNAATALVNDLDLTVTTPAAVQHLPLILTAGPANVNDLATEGADHINNIEQIVINNPAAGSYTIQVNGLNVATGSQQYIISYETDVAGITVEYPAGGEKLVPGETERIRWTAYGNEANTFTVEYSDNNGSSWNLISNNVAANARSILLTVPAGFTNTALVKVSRNGSGENDQSNLNFTVLGSPAITVNNACEGAVQLTWPAIAGATSYQVLQLNGDSMEVIGTTTNTNFILKGLDKNKKNWLSVAAVNGTTVGRRSIAVSIVASSGPCTLPDFINDLKVDTILAPSSARQGFANAANATAPVQVNIRNLGSVAVSGPFDVSYSYNGNTVTEKVKTTIAAGGNFTYTFSGSYTILPAGYNYKFKAWATMAADGNHLNDTAYKTVKYITNNLITAMPVKEGFETMLGDNFTNAEMAIGENSRIDFSASGDRGRARTFVNTGFAYNGSRALTLDQTPYNVSTTTDTITLSYNLLNYAARQLRFDFYYKNHGQENAPGNKIWIRGSENNNWVVAYDLFDKQSSIGNWKQGNFNINEVLQNAVPSQAIGTTFQLRIGQQGKTSANSAIEVIDIDDGYTFDDIELNEATDDVAMIKVNSPDAGDCDFTASNPISIKIKNYNGVAFSNVPVSYQVNNGPVITEIIPLLAASQTLDYTFSQTADLSAYIDYQVKVWVKYTNDSYVPNDSITDYVVHNSPVITSYPYLQSFESNDGFFYTKGTNSTWQWGSPAKVVINKPANGTKAWVTSLEDNYKDSETSYLYSPCFNLAALTQPMLSFSHIFQIEKDYDYTWVEYSTNGLLWQKLGSASSGTNWYDNNELINWTNSKTRWHVASIALPPVSSIRFRFVLSTDGGVTEEGIGIDDIHVFDKAAVYAGPSVTGIAQAVSGGNWVHFLSGGNRVVSINPNGANLGNTVADVFNYTGAVRYSNNAYYANRNIVVRPQLVPTGKVGMRFYFTDAEAQTLIAATGCATCAKPIDPYELGLTKYSGSATDENDLLEDDMLGLFRFITPDSTSIVPYDNGYYAEVSVNSFSEYWLSSASIKPVANGVCPGENMVLNAASNGSAFQWQVNNGGGFITITDGALYAGTNMGSLQLINLPTSYTGYQYRCVVNGVPGPVTTIRFTSAWIGAVSNNWFAPGNWSCGIVPDQYTDVIIPGGIAVYPLVNATAVIRRISAQPGSTITLAAGVLLDVTGK